jgi:signal transduction histidine kinase/CheY-like chemotaxis protein
VDKVPIYFELRTTMPWKPPGDSDEPDGEPQTHYKWILCSAYPELDDNNDIVEIVGNVTDISKQKWAEGLQKLKIDSALQSKRHLEHFIDTTSHEMRNPLSAIMQCADGILSSCPRSDNNYPVPSPTTYANLLDQTLDAAQTILGCSQHMKRIVDDILTISKLDSGLLAITPVDAEPKSVASHAVKMFESEAKAAGVDMALHIDQSYRDLEVVWVSLDPTRLLQVLINLITNALKFTRLEPTRRIIINLAATEKRPASTPDGVEFETKLVPDDPHLVDDWKQGSSVYLQFSVTDTGRGLTDEERSTLFARFSQASPRTHIHYGGSGLGLFISRRLTEMQGGAIGLSSKYKHGSTFSFYIKARRTVVRNVRRPSYPSVYPEDMRHRATTRKEIDQMQRHPNSPSRDKFDLAGRTSPKTPYRHPTRPLLDKDCVGSLLSSPRPPSFMRQQSALNADVPPETMGLPRDPDLAELKRTNSIPNTLHVLVVEDNLVNQKVLAKQLRNLGCIVSVANHGAEALDFLKKTSHWKRNDTPPTSTLASNSETVDPFNDMPVELSLILMDWEMPVMNGLTAVACIRDLERKGVLDRHIPVIGVTANVRPQQIEKAMSAGMDDVVSKPFRVAELMGRIRGFVDVGDVGVG